MRGKRRFLIGPALLLGPGCVLPVGPEFHAETNQPPFVIEARPAVGSTVTDQRAFSVTIGDPNITDTLYARWLIDYPPFNPALTWHLTEILGSDNTQSENRHTINLRPECGTFSPALSRHQLMLVVADRPFIDNEETVGAERRLDQTSSDANAIRLFWTFERDCR